MADNKNVTDDDELINDTLASEDEEAKKQEQAQREQAAEARRDRIRNTKKAIDESDNAIVAKIRDKYLAPVRDAIKDKLVEPISKFLKMIFDFIKQHLFPTLGSVITFAAVIVIAIGLISFILNAPAFLRGKLEEIINETVGKIYITINGENAKLTGKSLDKEKRIELLNYISSDLGLDVIGLGFVPTATYETGEENDGKQKILDYNSHLGAKAVIDEYNNEDTSNPDADLIYYYLMANERAYMKNDNGLFNLGALFGNKWEGMLNIEDEGISVSTEIDRASKTMKLKYWNPSIKDGLLSKDTYSFSLEGWTGRYGMPLEFSLALHVSTMSSGLVKEMITNPDLQTEVHIGLKKLDCDLNFEITLASGAEINMPYNPPSNRAERLFELITSYMANEKRITYNESNEEADEDEKNEKQQRINEIINEMSIRGVVYAANKTISEGALDASKIGFEGAAKELDAITALLETNDIAVRTNDGREEGEYTQVDQVGGLFVYQTGDNELSRISSAVANANTYNIGSGAFICAYDENGNPNTSLGKLSKNDYVDCMYGNVHYNYSVYFKKYKETDDYECYQMYYKETGKDEQEALGYQLVPKKSDVDMPYALFENSLGDTTQYAHYKRVNGLGSIYQSKKDEIENMSEIVTLSKIYQNQDAYIAMFKEIDCFLAWVKLGYGNEFYGSYNANLRLDAFNDYTAYAYYETQFYRVLDEIQAGNFVQAKLDLWLMLYSIDTDREFLRQEAPKTSEKSFKDYLNEFLVQKVGEGLTVENLAQVIEVFGLSSDVDNLTVKYAQPYIKYVTRHWFKDVIFDISENQSFSGLPEKTIYTPSSDPLEIKYKGSDLKDIQVKAILTPQAGNNYYVQANNKQPYVIKGRTVLQDGKIIGSVSDNPDDEKNANTIDYEDASVYHLGAGYRATKKIFTEGMYYTFDGSAETSKSIFWQQQLENANPGDKFIVTVISGNIYHVTPEENSDFDFNDDKLNPKIDASEFNTETGITIEGYAADYVIPQGILKPSFDEKGNLVRGGGARYWLVIPPDFKYVSPTEQEYSSLQEQVDKKINPIWEAMGVKNLRQHVSFDNVTSGGELAAQTGLSILKNCNTLDAEYIYRDLKEMLIDLGYYTEAEFDQLDVKLEWFIPRYATKHWPQNNPGDLSFAAVLNPYDEELDADAGTDSNSADENSEAESEEKKDEVSINTRRDKGFKEGLEVIAPGACKVVEISESPKYITIEFDGVRQPDISILDGYRMKIYGIEITATEGSELNAGDELGKTGKEQISVFLENDIGRTLSNVSDYMAPPEADPQPYNFTEDEIILLAYIINHEGSPEGMKEQMQYDIDRGYIVSYDDAESAALAYAAGIGYVLTNRAITNYGGYGTTIEAQSTAKGQYDGSFTIEYALAHQGDISEKSMEAALIVATYDCNYIKKPDDPRVTMSRDVIGESAWLWNGDESKEFWWLDQDQRDGDGVYGKGVRDVYSTENEPHTTEHPYPVNEDDDRGTKDGSNGFLKWPWDGYLTYR